MTPTEIIESSAVLGGIRTRKLEVAGDGPPILMLHGFSDSADAWRPVLEHLAGIGRRGVAVDLPGSGHADPLDHQRTFQSLDRFTEEFVLTIGDGSPVVLAGNSLGGLLALRVARRPDFPLLAVAPISPGGLAHTKYLELVARGVRVSAPIWSLLCRVPVPRRLLTIYLRTLYNRRLLEGSGDPALGRYYASHYASLRDLGRVMGDLVAIAEGNRVDPIVPADIRVPVLLIWGKRDRLANVAGAQLVLDAVPVSRLVVLEQCGHSAQAQRPVDVAKLVADLPASASRDATDPGPKISRATA
jgi:pimeloyl-ACP methyl ester carboxylesterase